MRVYLESLGCRLNYAEMAALGRKLAAAGHHVAESAAEADVCVVNSCAVTGEAARQSRQLARQLARANPTAKLVVTGCYATLESETVAALPNVELVVGNTRKEDLLELLEEQVAGEGLYIAGSLSVGQPAPFNLQPATSAQSGRTRAFVKVQDGCRNHCTFCIVTVARGAERSRPPGEIVAEVNALHRDGYQEAVITGVHLGGYGSDIRSDLHELVTALLADTRIPRLRLSSLEPFDLAPDFFALWRLAPDRLMPHLHLPAQSGSDAVLRRMARRNRVAEFEALVEAARAHIPGLTITTDLIVGFPGETEAHFAETVAFARRNRFAHMHIFPYSAREGTAAARFAGQVPAEERKRRVRILHELDAELGREVRADFVAQIRPVLWEQAPDVPHDAGPAMRAGLTDNYLRVQALAPAHFDLHNRITATRLVGLHGDQLTGELV